MKNVVLVVFMCVECEKFYMAVENFNIMCMLRSIDASCSGISRFSVLKQVFVLVLSNLNVTLLFPQEIIFDCTKEFYA